MNTSDFYYELPQELIAQTPPADRSASRLLLYDRNTRSITDGEFSDVASHLHPGDVLVRNTTRVIPARLIGVREDTGGHMEFLLLRRAEGDRWECLAKPARRARPGQEYRVGDGLRVRVLGDTGAEGGKLVELLYDGILEEVLDRVGQTPLPPYITERLEDPERYQTVYARERGSAAAPTAGLHFTQALLDRLRAQGVRIVDVLLHVGLGTFRPVSAERVEDHHMHAEYCEVTAEAARAINEARAAGGRVCRGGDDFRAHAGKRGDARWACAAVCRADEHLHHAGLCVPCGGCADHELSFAGIDAAHARIGLCGPGGNAARVQARRAAAVPVFQLWRCHADRVRGENNGRKTDGKGSGRAAVPL